MNRGKVLERMLKVLEEDDPEWRYPLYMNLIHTNPEDGDSESPPGQLMYVRVDLVDTKVYGQVCRIRNTYGPEGRL